MKNLILIAIVLIAGIGVTNAQEQPFDLSLEKGATPIVLRSAGSVPAAPSVQTLGGVIGMNSFFELFAYSSGATSYEWAVSGADIHWGQGTDNLIIKATRCYIDVYVRVRAKNAYGYSSYTSLSIPMNCDLPNPE